MPCTDWKFISNMRFPLPPISEKTAIVRYLDQATVEIDISINRARRQVELVHEYRERLVSDIVTGKLDVRELRADAIPDTDTRQESDRTLQRWASADTLAAP